MQEIGERYRRVHEAIERSNGKLADYHWNKLGKTLELGLVKRPKHAANARAIFLGEAFQTVRNDFKSGDPVRMRAGFERARQTCTACQSAENADFLNHQALFDLRFDAPAQSR